MFTWKEPLDHEGDHTYTIDFGPEMAKLGNTLSTCVVTLSTEAIAAGLNIAFEQVVGDVYSCKFSIPVPGNQVFSAKGKPLRMKVTYTSSGGEVDSFTAVVHIKDK